MIKFLKNSNMEITIFCLKIWTHPSHFNKICKLIIYKYCEDKNISEIEKNNGIRMSSQVADNLSMQLSYPLQYSLCQTQWCLTT